MAANMKFRFWFWNIDVQTCLRLIFLCLSFSLVLCSLYDKEVNDPCTSSGKHGICLLVYDCPEALESLKMRRMHKMKTCGFKGMTEIVCCQIIEKGPPLPETQETKSSLQACQVLTTQLHNALGGVDYHIKGGVNARKNEFPHMAALGYEDTTGVGWDCGAAIISNRFLLTAAHCLTRPVKLLKVRVGVSELNDTAAQDIKPTRIIAHPDYDPISKKNDIALIELEENLIFSESIFPACLHQEDNDPPELIVTGWGTAGKQDDRSNILQKAKVSPIPLDACNSTYYRKIFRTIGPTQLCAYGKQTDTCWGDSGGPILTEKDGMYTVVGITSNGMGCGGTIPGVYTRVSKYLDWIKKKAVSTIDFGN